MLRRLVLTVVLLPTIAFAQGAGYSLYGITSDKFGTPDADGSACQAVLKAIGQPKRLNLSILWHTFGDNLECLNAVWAASPQVHLQIHLWNGTCQRNGTCGPREFTKGMPVWKESALLERNSPKLKHKFDDYVAPAQQWLKEHPVKRCYVSPELESDITSAKASRRLLNWTRKAFPRCAIVWNPVGNNHNWARGPHDLIEQHGWSPYLPPSGCIANLDGDNILWPQLPHRVHTGTSDYATRVPHYVDTYRRCALVMLWVSESNCVSVLPPLLPEQRPCLDGGVYKLLADLVRQNSRR